MRVGDVVADRFQLEELAGEGGTSTVFRARDLHSGAQVALELLHGAPSDPDRERFAREAGVLAELHHPGLAGHVAHGFTPTGEPYLAMEWLEGELLSDRLGDGGLSISEAVTLARRVAEALGAIHALDVVHGDLEPRKLRLPGGDADRVKLVDFGISRRGIEPRPGTRTGVLAGAPAYTAPEQARGSAEIGPQADVFSLGCVLFECLAGRPPFVGDDLVTVLLRILVEDPPRASTLRPDVSPALDELVARMLSKDPGGRPPDGTALAGELAAIDPLRAPAEGRPPQAPPSPTPGELRLASVLLVSLAPAPGERGPSLTLPPEEVTAPVERLRVIAAPVAARIDHLADGPAIATFIAPGGASDRAIHAARCALAMCAARPDVTVAVATGRNLLDVRIPVGEAIDRAAELLRARGAAAGRCRVLVDDVTAALIEPRFELGGAPEALELLAERDAEGALRTLLGKPTPCVGRDRELAELEAMFHECVTEPVARAILVTGAAGMGKSRLRYELLRRIRQRGGPMGRDASAEIWTAQGDPLRAGSPFGVVGQLLRRAAGLRDGEPLEARQGKLRARVALHVGDRHAARRAEFLGELAGAPFPDHDSVQLREARRDPLLMGEQLRRAWEVFLAAECRAHPVLLVLEDLHWGDLPSVQLLDGALRAMPQQPLMVLALARPEIHERFPKLWQGAGARELRLGKLPRKAGEQLVREVLGERVSGERVARIVEQAAGNALYLEELIRAIADDSRRALPGSVLAMLQSRLEALDPVARQVIRAASVFGEVCWGGGVAALLGGAEAPQRVDDWLAALAARELLAPRRESKFPGEQEYEFRHALVHEAAYQMLADDDRAAGHRLAGAWLEQQGEQDALVLAEHFERGGERALAATLYHRAAEHALEASDHAAVLQRAERALACGAEGELRGAVLRLKAEAHVMSGDNLVEAEACDEEAMRLLPRGSAGWFEAVAGVAAIAFHRGDHDRVTALVEELGSPAQPSALASQAVAISLVVRFLLRTGMLELAERLYAKLVALKTEAAHAPMALGHAHAALAERALFAGDPAAAREELEASIEHLQRAGHLSYLLVRRVNAASTLIDLGQYARAASELKDVLDQVELGPPEGVIPLVKARLGLALARRGALREARSLVEAGAAEFQRRGISFYESVARGYLALILIEAGLPDAASREAERAVAVCEARSRRCAALGILAHVRLRQGRAREADEAATEAMRLLEPLGGLEEGEALVRLVFAEALDAIGDRPAARTAILAAEERLRARAGRIEDPAWKASFLEQVPENARTLELAARWR